MGWIIWIAGSIGIALMFDYETLALYVTAGLVMIVGTSIGRRHAADATGGMRAGKE